MALRRHRWNGGRLSVRPLAIGRACAFRPVVCDPLASRRGSVALAHVERAGRAVAHSLIGRSTRAPTGGPSAEPLGPVSPSIAGAPAPAHDQQAGHRSELAIAL